MSHNNKGLIASIILDAIIIGVSIIIGFSILGHSIEITRFF